MCKINLSYRYLIYNSPSLPPAATLSPFHIVFQSVAFANKSSHKIILAGLIFYDIRLEG